MQILSPQNVTHTGTHTQLLAARLNGKMLLSPLTYNLAGKNTHTHTRTQRKQRENNNKNTKTKKNKIHAAKTRV